MLQPDEKPTAEAAQLKKKAISKFKSEQYTPWRLMLAIITAPVLLLVVTVQLMNWVYTEKFAQTPCQGICDINETVLAGHPSSPLLQSDALGAYRSVDEG